MTKKQLFWMCMVMVAAFSLGAYTRPHLSSILVYLGSEDADVLLLPSVGVILKWLFDGAFSALEERSKGPKPD